MTMPGSISATRVQYALGAQAFHNPQMVSADGAKVKAEVVKMKRPQKLGVQAEWNPSTQAPTAKFPDRPQMHSLSEYQSIKMEYNFRGEKLPDTLKNSVFVPRTNKFQFDQTKLLSTREKTLQVATNPSLNSRAEFTVHPDLTSRWNDSTQVTAADRKVAAQDPKELTKAKNARLLGNSYIGPKQRETIRTERVRAIKLAKREQENAAMTECPLPYTLTNLRRGLLPDMSGTASFAVSQPISEEDPDEKQYEMPVNQEEIAADMAPIQA